MMSSGRGRYAAQRALSRILDRTSRRCGLASALIQRLPAQPDRTDLRPESVRLQLVRQAPGLQRRCGVRFRDGRSAFRRLTDRRREAVHCAAVRASGVVRKAHQQPDGGQHHRRNAPDRPSTPSRHRTILPRTDPASCALRPLLGEVETTGPDPKAEACQGLQEASSACAMLTRRCVSARVFRRSPPRCGTSRRPVRSISTSPGFPISVATRTIGRGSPTPWATSPRRPTPSPEPHPPRLALSPPTPLWRYVVRVRLPRPACSPERRR